VAEHLVIYALIHQPRRVRLPAQPLPRGAPMAELEPLIFDDDLNHFYFDKVTRWCYAPAIRLWRELLDGGLRLGFGVPLSVIPQFEAWAPEVLADLRALVGHDHCELVAVEPDHAVSMLLDLDRFIAEMKRARTGLAKYFGKRPTTADTTEMLMSSDIYRALQEAGYRAGFIDGRPWVMGWRSPTYLYNFDGGDLSLLTRHFDLSDDVGYRFSNWHWSGWPLTARTYAEWIRAAPGDVAVVAWDFETFGEHHIVDTGVFEFLRWLPDELARCGVAALTPAQATRKFARRKYDLPLTPFPATWAGIHGSLEFFLGNRAQRAIFRLMAVAYFAARRTRDPAAVDIAAWLMQSDNLHWLQWVGHTGAEADVSAYFTPREWLRLGADRLVWEHQRVYVNFIEAIG